LDFWFENKPSGNPGCVRYQALQLTYNQGDRIGRIFALCAIVYFGQFVSKLLKLLLSQKQLCIKFNKILFGQNYDQLFSQKNLVTLLTTNHSDR
jgi:hypothetical protein